VIPAPLCPVCGRPTRKVRSKQSVPTCRYCRREENLDHGRAWTLFVPPLDKIIHHFKYRRQQKIGRILGRGMATVLKYDFFLKQSDLITPVPLFWWKRLRRGYNQSQVLARVIQQECGIPVCDLLVRRKNTKTQTRLTETRRKENVRDAFRIKNDAVADKKILLVDDVMTTGATIRECARILKAAGAERVYSLVAAITP
jgi:ComF family protein